MHATIGAAMRAAMRAMMCAVMFVCSREPKEAVQIFLLKKHFFPITYLNKTKNSTPVFFR